MINIVIPVYNVERYIRRCLDSVKNQTCPEFKAILVDDGSTDNCGLICDEYAKADERFIVFHKQNGGLTSAVKYGIKNSPKCDYFMFVDSDDFLEVTAVEKVSKAIEQSSADIINYDFFVDFEVGKKQQVASTTLPIGLVDEAALKEKKKSYVLSKELTPTRWNKVFSSAIVYDSIDYYNEKVSVAEDWLFTTINLFNAKTLFYIKEPLTHYYQNEASMTHKYKEGYFDSYKVVYQELKRYFREGEIAERVFFQHLKTLVQMLFLYGGSKEFTKNQLTRIALDKEVKELFVKYKPKGLNNKILKFLIKRRAYILLKILTKINNL